MTSWFNRTFRNQVLVFSRGPVPSDYVGRWEVVRVPTREDLTSEQYDALIAEEGALINSLLEREFSLNGIMWLALVDGNIAGYAWSRRYDGNRGWYVKLNPDDVIVLATVTFVAYRGRGLMSDLVLTAIREEVPSHGRAYIDCKAWNVPAIKYIERSGFERIQYDSSSQG